MFVDVLADIFDGETVIEERIGKLLRVIQKESLIIIDQSEILMLN